MISKERLEELIEQRATIYYVANQYWDNSGDWRVIDHKLTKTRVKDLGGIEEIVSNRRFFEIKEEAEWYKEFGYIERTERLELPTWEKFINKKIKQVCFIGRDTICFFELYIDEQNNRLILLDHDCDYEYFNEEMTKENYTFACRKAKELFLGEENE